MCYNKSSAQNKVQSGLLELNFAAMKGSAKQEIFLNKPEKMTRKSFGLQPIFGTLLRCLEKNYLLSKHLYFQNLFFALTPNLRPILFL
jgi:hypothetical protein